MFKRLHSNRDPRDTLFSEVKKEFGGYFEKAGNRFTGLTDRYPKFLFGAMVTAMLLSIGLSLTVFRIRPPAAKPVTGAVVKKPPKTSLSPVTDGFSQIFRIGDAIKETIALKKVADSLIAKKNLTQQDSITLEKTLDRLQQTERSEFMSSDKKKK
jgi:hypothetical protein